MKSVGGSAKSTVLSAADLNAADVEREWKVLATLGTLSLAILVFMALGHHEDLKSSAKVVDSKLRTAKGVEKLSKSTLIHKSGVSKKKRLNNKIMETSNKELALLEESLPRVLGPAPPPLAGGGVPLLRELPQSPPCSLVVGQHHRDALCAVGDIQSH